MLRQAIVGVIEDHGTAVVAVASALLAIAASCIRPRWLTWVVVALGPLPVAVAVYWTPFWSRVAAGEWSGSAEYDAWAWVAIPPWYALGVAVAAAVAVATRRLVRSRHATVRGSR